ncbi:membrane-bound lytic murein transglycosylase MltF [Marinobacter salinisoli]|uniref:Membrane-bound lytic murein transglycosylase F n=1 Tax=Marinobacter salinisoli TaxID=2769486 RepID=A0ABX7MPN8_9GAMM|nr:membrane-bound lytic murein transglycosylase MltF [Marinobacter salinisoli]QSP94281.1 membrane-bound lytic murein transglycosylase MltF [Marinobacter salinisoli]
MEFREVFRSILEKAAAPARIPVLVCAALVIAGCSRPSTLQEIRDENVLHVIAREAPSIYFDGRDGPTGYDFELAKRFAKELGVKLRVRVAQDNTEVLSVLSRNFAHIGLAGLSAQPGLEGDYQTLPTGISAQSVVVYNRDFPAPDSLPDLAGNTLHMVAESNHQHLLEDAKVQSAGTHWQVHPGLDAAGILARVETGEFGYAVVSSNELELNHVFFPKVKEAFALGEPEELVWLFPAAQDDTLLKAARQFLKQLQANGTQAQLAERFYGHLDRLNYVGARTFMHHVDNRLPKYSDMFRNYAREYGVDWRLLAAIGYQESHWRPNAVSPTGVRGLMMLTRNTAKYIGINNRLDAEQSIHGGAKYFRMVHDQIPDRIPEPDRTWFALASYNVGFGHLEDARRLAQNAGRDPDRWMDVKEFLPLLAQKEWYTKTRFGYARGHEPVLYVQNIRRYYDVLARVAEPANDDGENAPKIVDLEAKNAGSDTGGSKKPNLDIQASLPPDMGVIPPTL